MAKFEFMKRSKVPDFWEKDTLLYRFSIINTPWFSIKLHHLEKSDDAMRGLHDHPWNFISVTLKGGYGEVMPDGLHKPKRIKFRRYSDLHRVVVNHEYKGAWTLVFTGRKQQEWGFVRDGEWTAWYETVGPHAIECGRDV